MAAFDFNTFFTKMEEHINQQIDKLVAEAVSKKLDGVDSGLTFDEFSNRVNALIDERVDQGFVEDLISGESWFADAVRSEVGECSFSVSVNQ